MNAIDGVFNLFTKFLKLCSKFIPSVSIPFEKYAESWNEISGYLATANIFLPIDTFITIMGIIFAFVGVMVVIWLISFILDLIPFF